MHFKCERSDLIASLNTVGLAVPQSTTHAILTNVAIEADKENNRVLLTGSDLCFTIKSEFYCDIENEGSITVPYKILKDMIQKLPDGELALGCEDEDALNPTLLIHSINGKYNLKGVEYDQYPLLEQKFTNENTLYLDIGALKKGLQHVLHSYAKDDTRGVLTGVNFKLNTGNELTLASTDGHRLSCITLEEAVNLEEGDLQEEPFVELEDNNFDLPETEEDLTEDDNEESEAETEEIEETEIKEKIKEKMQVTIKGKELGNLLAVLNTQNEETLTMTYDEKYLSFRLKNTVIDTRILNGAFPKYEQLIPQEFTGNICCDKDVFTKGLDRISVLLSGSNNLVKFFFDEQDDNITFVSVARDLGEARTIVQGEVTKSLNIGFNYNYILDAIKVCKTRELKIKYNEANTPVIISGLGDPSAFTLVMPVQIRD